MNWEKIGGVLAQQAKDLSAKKLSSLTFADKLKQWYAQNQQEILVLGCSGVGKTQFVYSLSDKTDEQLARIETRKHQITTLKLEDFPLKFIDTVGHIDAPHERDDVFYNRLNNEKLIGIINVVSFGYQENDQSKEHEVFATDTPQVQYDFLERGRQDELAYMEKWLPDIPFSKVKWIITLVNKMDVWKREASIVQSYYEKKEMDYQQAFIKPLEQTLQRQNRHVPHYVLPYISALELFWDRHPIFVGESEKRLVQRYFRKILLELIQS